MRHKSREQVQRTRKERQSKYAVKLAAALSISAFLTATDNYSRRERATGSQVQVSYYVPLHIIEEQGGRFELPWPVSPEKPYLFYVGQFHWSIDENENNAPQWKTLVPSSQALIYRTLAQLRKSKYLSAVFAERLQAGRARALNPARESESKRLEHLSTAPGNNLEQLIANEHLFADTLLLTNHIFDDIYGAESDINKTRLYAENSSAVDELDEMLILARRGNASLTLQRSEAQRYCDWYEYQQERTEQSVSLSVKQMSGLKKPHENLAVIMGSDHLLDLRKWAGAGRLDSIKAIYNLVLIYPAGYDESVVCRYVENQERLQYVQSVLALMKNRNQDSILLSFPRKSDSPKEH